MKTTNTSTDAAASCVFLCGLLLLKIGAAVLCWPYALNAWLDFAGKPHAITWWQGALIGFIPFIGRVRVSASVAFITFVLLLFLK
jgi:hypothetical protein